MNRKYYVHDRVKQSGPFSLGELEKMNLKSNTLIWYLGLSDWLTLDKIPELHHLIKEVVPPVLGVSKDNQLQVFKLPIQEMGSSNTKSESSNSIFIEVEEVTDSKSSPIKKKDSSNKLRFVLYTFVSLCFVLILIIYLTTDTYQEKLTNLKEIENSDPLSFLSTDGEYRENFLGNKINIEGVIANSASVANYKDLTIRVSFYTKTQTMITEEDYIIYEFFPANSKTEFKLSVPNYKNTESISWRIIEARSY